MGRLRLVRYRVICIPRSSHSALHGAREWLAGGRDGVECEREGWGWIGWMSRAQVSRAWGQAVR